MRALALLVLVAALTGCALGEFYREQRARADALRRAAYLDDHRDLSAGTQAAIREGRVEPGMTPGEAWAAWGPPDAVLPIPGGARWHYRPLGEYHAEPLAVVIFTEGRVAVVTGTPP